MANEQWNHDIAYAMTPFKLITWPIGVWPLQVYDVYSLIRCVFGTCCSSLMVILPSIELYMGCTNAEQNVDCLMLICCGMLGDDDSLSINITNENSVREYTIPSRCALEYFNASNSIYRIVCFIETIALILATSANIGNDAMFLNITLHMCGQVKILRTNFMDIDVTSSRAYDRFNILIQRHIYLIHIVKQLAETISFILLTQLFISSILLCIMGFQLILSLKVNDIVMTTKSFSVLSAFLSQLTLYSFIGDYLKSQMEEIGLSIYRSSWYDYPRKLTRNMIFVLMRTESPIALQAGNFIMINLSTYMSILKTSASYLSVLRVMIEI
ncbi:odorant receptor 13a isoform X2 [Ooceraea biroi]|uniref:odorant receptor 13a isoform X2 n=1 Tax=Ooceraea biroi TaxID=2015173 RepID=UPI000F073767|nr:odorant receptor 13a isoform X2 [Ooceraea biroi]